MQSGIGKRVPLIALVVVLGVAGTLAIMHEESHAVAPPAGGTTDANIARWREQFSDDNRDARVIKTVHGLTVTIVEIRGTFLGGSMSDDAPTPKKGWALLAAIVEGNGDPYFFKRTGPVASVNAARAAFDAMIESCAPEP